jgi:hypothetical protein
MALVGHISGSSQSNSVIGVSGSVIVANRPNSLFPSFPGTDVTFFVSGALDNTNVSVFGGKLVVSGGISSTTISGSGDFNVGGDLRIAGDLRVDGNDVKSSTGVTVIAFTGSNVVIPGDLTVNGTTVTVSSSNLVIFDQLIGIGFESGSISRVNGDRGLIGGLATGDNASVFWDNSESEFAVVRTDSTPESSSVNVVSYAQLHVATLTGSLVKSSALTGSLTKLLDGSDYLRAGTNITLTTGSVGEITITATGGGDVSGPGSSTTNAIALFSDTTGKIIKNSDVLIGTSTSQNIVSMSLNPSLTNSSLALIPNGTGSLVASNSGNARGINAVDFQMERTDVSQVAAGDYSTIGGGQRNKIASGSYGTWSVIGGGYNNEVASGSVIVGGRENVSTGTLAFVGGGYNNKSSGDYSIIAGGQANSVSATHAVIVGGESNNVTHNLGFIGGGQYNEVSGTLSFIGGGQYNKVGQNFSNVIGGQFNEASEYFVSVVGGQYVTASGRYSVAGGINNTAQSYAETVVGAYATTGAGNSSAFVLADRLLVVGNGTGDSTRSNALTLLKSGDMHLSGTLTLMSGSTSGITFPSTRGNSGDVLTSDGAGMISWAAPTTTTQYFSSTTAGSIYTTGSAAFIGAESIDSPSDKGSDVFFYVSGSTDMSAASNALFGGSVIVSGSLGVEGDVALGVSSLSSIVFNGRSSTDLLPMDDMQYNLGSPSNRWANVYTGDLHLRNDRGNWTVIEEDEYLSIRNNKTGKMFKFVLEPV